MFINKTSFIYFMGLIRSILIIISTIVLFLSLFIGNAFLTLAWSLEYDTVQPEISSLVKDLAEKEFGLSTMIDENLKLMELFCQDNPEFVFSQEEYTLVIPCEVILLGSDALLNYGIQSLTEQIYYKTYDCDFWNCIKLTDKPFVLVSEKARDYWNNKFYITFLLSLTLAILLFFLFEEKHSSFIVIGGLLILSSLPFMKISWVLSFVSADSLMSFLPIFFIRAYNVFLMALLMGLGFVGVGIGLTFFNIGFKITNFISKFSKGDLSKKDVKDIVKQEVTKSKKQQPSQKTKS